jgi:cytoskeletal protein RodZ
MDMKWIKIYLGIVTVLLVAGIAAGVYVWFTVQALDEQVNQVNDVSPKNSNDEVSPTNTKTDIKKPTTQTQTNETVTVSDVNTEAASPQVNTAPITVTTTNLPESQQKLLKSLGIDADTITITPTMISCAEKAVGKTRLDEIVGGSSPSALESLKLLPCFKA